MSKVFVIRGFIVSFLLSLSSAMKEKCSQDDLLSRCTMALPVLSSPNISFALTKDELDKNCVELRAGIRCIDNFTDVCMEKNKRMVFRQIYSGIAGVVKELCTEGAYQNEYLKHASCVMKSREEYDKCSKRYEVTLTSISNSQKNAQYETDQSNASHEDNLKMVCCSFQEYLRCSEQTVQRKCGDEAAVFTSAFLKRMSSNIIKNFCHEYRGKECPSKATSLQYGVFFLATPLLMLHRQLFPA